MPPASRGINTFSFRNATRSRHKRRFASTAPPKPLDTSQAGSAQRVRVRASQLRPSDLVKSGNQAKAAEHAEPATPLTKWQEAKRRLEYFVYPQFLRERPRLRGVIFGVFTAVPITAFLMSHSPYEIRRVTGPSMQPTINPDYGSDNDRGYSPSWVLVRRWDLNYQRMIKRKQVQEGKVTVIAGDYARGDIIVYSTPHDPYKVAIKRVVGVAGDVVTPLNGYPGGNEPIVVPFNHIWVEGDVNDRKRSVDSNYFGPIATGLIKGRVVALWSPWWKVFSPRPLQSDNNDWPARRQERVKEDAVHDASINPDRIEIYSTFVGERGAKMLQLLRTRSIELEEEFLVSEDRRLQVWRVWQRALVAARKHHDPEARQCARDVVDELERLHGKNALKAASALQKSEKRKPGQQVSQQTLEAQIAEHFESATAYEDVRAEQRKARESPARAAMEEMRRQQKAYGEMIDKEFEERDRIREARGV